MSVATRTLPGRIEPSRVYFGGGECTKITAIADVALSLEDTYWQFTVPASLFNSTKTAEAYYVWYDGGTGTDPTIAGQTGIQVVYSSGDDAATIASLTKTALDGMTPLRVRTAVDGADVTMENREIGAPVSVPADSVVPTGFTFEQLSAGFGGDLGATTQDGMEISFESESVDIQSLQSGSLVLDKFYLGGSISLSLGLQEMDINTWELALKSTGSRITPAGGTDVVGIGEGTLFRSFLANGGQLVLKPLSTAADDNSRNQTFWRAAPQPESVNFSNEIQALAVSFNALLDPSVDNNVNAWMFGDQDQDGLFL